MDNNEKYKLCPKFEKAFELLGKRWTGLIIQTLLSGNKRFTDIEIAIPNISARMLTERFKELEQQGMIHWHCITTRCRPKMAMQFHKRHWDIYT